MAKKAIAYAIAQNPEYLVEIHWEYGNAIMLSNGTSIRFENGRAKIPLRLFPEVEQHGCRRI